VSAHLAAWCILAAEEKDGSLCRDTMYVGTRTPWIPDAELR
jgi:hypothetical protein